MGLWDWGKRSERKSTLTDYQVWCHRKATACFSVLMHHTSVMMRMRVIEGHGHGDVEPHVLHERKASISARHVSM